MKQSYHGKKTMSHHAVITGTGRSGTTFLVELLTQLGLETGFDPAGLEKHETARAGLEINLLDAISPPYIVKDPAFGLYLSKVFERNDLILDHVFITVRDINAAAQSRRYIEEISNKKKYKAGGVPGGLTGTEDGDNQEEILKNRIFQLILGLSETDCEVTIIKYPLMIQNAAYLYDKLTPILGGISFKKFNQVFSSVAQPSLVSKFNENDTAGDYIKYKSTSAKKFNSSPATIFVQLFIDYGKGFSEKDSITAEIDKDVGIATFDLPSDKLVKRLRFDPANEACSVDLLSVKATAEGGKVYEPELIETNGYLQDGSYYFPTVDGQWHFAVKSKIRKIEFQIGYKVVGPSAKVLSTSIIEKQLKLEIYKLKKELALHQEPTQTSQKQKISIIQKIKNRRPKK